MVEDSAREPIGAKQSCRRALNNMLRNKRGRKLALDQRMIKSMLPDDETSRFLCVPTGV